MAKVVTSEGLTAFVQEGKFESVKDKPPEKPAAQAPALEVVGGKPPEKAAPEKAEAAPEVKAEEPEEAENEDGLTESDTALAERTRKRIVNLNKQRKDAQREAIEAERFAENQYNERRLAEQRALAAEERAKELEAKLAPPPPPEVVAPKTPKIEDFRTADGQIDWYKYMEAKDKYTDAKAEFESNQAVEKLKKEQREAAEAAARAAAEAEMKKRFDKVRQAHPDFDKVIEQVKGTAADNVPPFVLNFLFKSANGAELHYHLMKNPAEAERISALEPILGLAELGKLEDRLTKPAATNGTAAPESQSPRAGGAPAPIVPLSSEGSVAINTDPSKMSYKELRAYERARARERH